MQLELKEAEKFYHEHQGKFFFQRLTLFMSSGPISTHILFGEDAVSKWRTLLGPTKVIKAQYEDPGSFRGSFGVTDTRNVGHGSDSEETALKEIAFFFPEFCYTSWSKTESRYFQNGKVIFNEEQFVHKPVIK